MAKKKESEEKTSVGSKALEAIQKIDEEARQKKEKHIDGLKEARSKLQEERSAFLKTIEAEIDELNEAIAAITGKAVAKKEGSGTRMPAKEAAALRERIVTWLSGRPTEKFSAAELQGHFPELSGKSVSLFLKAQIDSKAIQTEGDRKNFRYFGKK